MLLDCTLATNYLFLSPVKASKPVTAFRKLRYGAIVEQENRQTASSRLEKCIEIAKRANVKCEAVVVQSRVPSSEIMKIAVQYECDVIFIAKQGRCGFIEMLFDENLADTLLEHVVLPVLVFPKA